MLAGEPFTDHPRSVCPVIGSLLRAYNDSIDDEGRQDLYAYAAKVVGSRARQAVERSRAEHLISWIAERQRRRWTRFLVPSRFRILDRMRRAPVDVIGLYVVGRMSKRDAVAHEDVLALIDDLLRIGTPRGSEEHSQEPSHISKAPPEDAPTEVSSL